MGFTVFFSTIYCKIMNFRKKKVGVETGTNLQDIIFLLHKFKIKSSLFLSFQKWKKYIWLDNKCFSSNFEGGKTLHVS